MNLSGGGGGSVGGGSGVGGSSNQRRAVFINLAHLATLKTGIQRSDRFQLKRHISLVPGPEDLFTDNVHGSARSVQERLQFNQSTSGIRIPEGTTVGMSSHWSVAKGTSESVTGAASEAAVSMAACMASSRGNPEVIVVRISGDCTARRGAAGTAAAGLEAAGTAAAGTAAEGTAAAGTAAAGTAAAGLEAADMEAAGTAAAITAAAGTAAAGTAAADAIAEVLDAESVACGTAGGVSQSLAAGDYSADSSVSRVAVTKKAYSRQICPTVADCGISTPLQRFCHLLFSDSHYGAGQDNPT
ncbi:antifreeze protein Maxi-like [Drosophila tropicalis]|uniref:antifreeze protein Maxi-like n=1 Tax=Drosophila tropicalis TaxID=46794 RepID=UPI0035ABBED7